MEGLVSKPGAVCGGDTCEVNGGGVVGIDDGGGETGFGEEGTLIGSFV